LDQFSFKFKGRSSKEFGLLATGYDFVMPPKRQRKQFVPVRDGAYDYGAEFFDERFLRMRCIWVSSMIGGMTRTDIREISYWLSQKGQLYLDVERDKWYIAELYDPSELIMHYNNRATGMTTDGEFELNFICEPFAYKDVGEKMVQSGRNEIDYKGTARTPCTIVLKNNNNFAVNNVQIAVTKRKS